MNVLWTNLGTSGQTWGLLNGIEPTFPPFPVIPGQPVLCVSTTHFAQSNVSAVVKNCPNTNDGDC